MFTTYRGDDRKPSEIKNFGIAARDDLGSDSARKKIREIFEGDAGAWASGQIAFHTNRYVVATDTMNKGQAFDRGDYIYKIEFRALPEVRDYAAHGIKLREGRHPFWPVLLTNSYNFELASILALRISRGGFAQEVDFFTRIPAANVVGWKTKLSGDDAPFSADFRNAP